MTQVARPNATQLVRLVFSILVVGSSVCFLYNVMADDSELRIEAGHAACGSEESREPWRVGRYPVWQTYGFRCSSGSVDVTCTRTFYLFGKYNCTLDAGSALPSRE